MPNQDPFYGRFQQILPQPDGKIYVAGYFSTTNSSSGIKNVARVNSDGTLDHSFNPYLSHSRQIYGVKLRVLANGDVLIWCPSGVNQRQYPGSSGLFRLQPDGYPIRYFQGVSSWLNEPLLETSKLEDVFTYGATVPRQIRKYTGQGVVSTNFPAVAVSGRLFAMEANDDGLLIGGNFTSVGGTVATNFAKLDLTTGELQTDFNPIINGTVHTVKTHGEKIYISGDFTEVNGQTRYRIARLNLDGTLDANFNPGLGPNRAPGVLDVQIDGSLIVGNGFGRVDGLPAGLLVRLEGDPQPGEVRLVSSRVEVSATNQFVTVEVERVGGSRGALSTTLFTVDGSALAGQHFAGTNITFTFADGEFGTMVLRLPLFSDSLINEPRTFSVMSGDIPTLEETTFLIRPLPLTASASVPGETNAFRDIAVDTNGWVYAVGSFTNVNGVAVTNIVRLNSDLMVDDSFRPADLPAHESGGVTNYFAPLNTVAVNEDGVAIGGLFNLVGTNNWANVVRLKSDGTYDEAFNTAARAAIVSSLETMHLLLQHDGKLVLQRGTLGTMSERLNRNGGEDLWNGTFHNGGEFRLDSVGRFYEGVSSVVNRYNTNGASEPFFRFSVRYQVPGSTASNPLLNTLAIQPDDKIILAGAFSHFDSTFNQPATPRLARVLTNLNVDTNFVAVVGTNTPGTLPKNRVTAIQLLPDGSILIGGLFDVVNGERRTMLALLNTNGELRNDFKVEVVGEQIDQFALLPDGDVVVRGKVSRVDGMEVGDLFKLSIPDMQAPVAKFLWPTNGAEVRVTNTQEIIQVHGFDPDGFVESVVLELNGQIVATNNSGNIPFQVWLPPSGEHQLRMIVTDDSGLTTSE